MSVCFNCGQTIYPEDKYCGQCGTKLLLGDVSPFSTQTELKVEDVRSKLGLVYFKMGKLDQALDEFKKILQSNPDDRQASGMVETIEKTMKDKSRIPS